MDSAPYFRFIIAPSWQRTLYPLESISLPNWSTFQEQGPFHYLLIRIYFMLFLTLASNDHSLSQLHEMVDGQPFRVFLEEEKKAY